ncbi:MAG: multifunctional CCA addition/repair protein [Pseudomonadota bacterium]
MNVYLVGGAVRDELLGLPVHERDWVVVGSTVDDMLARGFRQVGNDFPVFLHPHSQEEYALARVERKTGVGYQGFAFDTAKEVTLEQDLERRDLTINAIAKAPDGTLVDPYGGRADIEERVIRHVSDAFSEDPLRVLRAARFTTRFASLNFSVSPDTMQLLSDIVAQGEMPALAAERVWSETARALMHDKPSVYFQMLRACGALAVLFPEVDALFGVPQSEQWHPEIDTGLHTLMVIDMAASMDAALPVRFAALVHDLGKAKTPPDQWPNHHGHERVSRKLVTQFGQRLRVPGECVRLAEYVAEFHTHCHRALELNAKTLLKTFESIGAFRKPGIVEAFAQACEADARGRDGLEARDYPQAAYFRGAFKAAQSVENAAIAKTGVSGKAFGEAVRRARLRAIDVYQSSTDAGAPSG